MAIAFKIRVFYLFAKLTAHTFVVLRSVAAAWAVPSGSFKTLLNGIYNFLIGI